MINPRKILVKLSLLREKYRIITLIEMESDFLHDKYGALIAEDLEVLQDELKEVNSVKNPTSDINKKKFTIQNRIQAVKLYQNMAKEAKESLTDQGLLIESMKRNLFK